MHICIGWLVPRSETAGKPLVLNVSLTGSRGAGAPQDCKQLVERGVYSRKKMKNEQKEEILASRCEMASMMHICSGLVEETSKKATEDEK